MKKFIATFVFALSVLAFATTTHAATFNIQEDSSKLTNCDLLKLYRQDRTAVKGSYLEVQCEFNGVSHSVTVTTDNQKLINNDSTVGQGVYQFSFENVSLPNGKLEIDCQKLSGGNAPHWEVLNTDTYTNSAGKVVLDDLTDNLIHYQDTWNSQEVKPALSYLADFGDLFDNSTEKIAIYVHTSK